MCHCLSACLQARLNEMQRQVPRVNVPLLVDLEPMMLKADLELVG
jgi:hypothetical protein